MKKYLFITVFFAVCNIVFAQTNSVKGRVANEKNEPVGFATVLIMSAKDSTVVKYATADNNGAYQIAQIANGQYYVEARCMGYTTQRTKIGLFGNNNLDVNFRLPENIIELEAAKVTANYTGIEFSGDTIRYNPLAYTDGSEVTLGDMISKLPGIEVSNGGKIKAQGKDVNAVLIEGRDLFSGNTQVPLQNLPANIAEKVEVVNNYSEYDAMKGFQSYEKTAINVKVNKNFWDKISGTVSVAGGVRNRYYTKNNIIKLMPKFMTSLILSGNNTGESLLQFDDYLKMKGGLNEFATDENSFTFSFDDADAALLMPISQNTYSNTNNIAIVNVSAQPNDKFKLNTYGLFNMFKSKDEDESLYTYFNSVADEHYVKSIKNVRRNKIGSGFLKLTYSPSKTMTYVYQGNVSDALSKSATDIDNIDFVTTAQNRRPSFSTGHNFTALKKIKNNVLTANFNFAYKYSPAEYSFCSDSLLLPLPVSVTNNFYYALQEKNTTENSLNINLSYLHKLNSAYFLRIALGVNYLRNKFISDIYQNVPNADKEPITGGNFSNNFYLGSLDESINARIVKNQGLFRFVASLKVSNINFKHNINRTLSDKNKLTLEPNLEISLVPKQAQRFSVSYHKSIATTKILDLVSGLYINSFDNYVTGGNYNNMFRNKHTVNVRFSDFNQFYNTQFYIFATYDKTSGDAAKDYYRTGSLNQAIVVASPDKYSFSAVTAFSKKFLFAPLSVNVNLNFRQNKYSYFTAGNEIAGKSHNLSAELGLSSSYKEGFNLGTTTKFSRNYYKSLMSNKQDVQRYSGKISFTKNNFYISTSLDYEHNNARSIMQNFYYWNADIRYSFAKKKYELQLVGTDMLHTIDKRWREIIYTDNAMIERFVRRLPGNIMLKFNMKIS
jgi:hypothetical protein